jgi:hypothetical protein
MSINLPNLYVQQFATNVQLLLQQKGSMLREAVSVGSYVGKQASPVDQIGSINMQPVTSRFAPMGRVDAATDRRWVFPSDFDLPQLIDQFDKLRMLVDPASSYVQNAANAAGRQMDDLIIAAFHGTAQTGETGATATVFGTNVTTASTPGNNVSVIRGSAAASGLTVAKLREAKRRLLSNFVDPSEQVYAVITSRQHDDLLAEAQVISTDFNDKPVLVDGRVTRFLGINFILCERLLTGTDDQSGTSRAIPVFVKSGVHLGLWNDITTDITQRKDLQGLPWQAYVYMTAGATRLEENKVVRVWARES